MRKTIYLIGALALMGCSSEDSKEDEKKDNGPSVCDCVNGGKEMRDKITDAGDDDDKIKEVEEQYKDLKEACEKISKQRNEEYKDADDDKKKALEAKWSEEMENCDK